jgi:hypothetical protein
MADEEKLPGQEAEPQEGELNQEPENNGDQEPQEDTVPLKTYLATKGEMKSLKKRLADLEQKQYTQDNLDYKSKTRQRYIDAGYEEGLADLIAEDIANIRDASASRRQSEEMDSIDEEINDLSHTDNYYRDAIEYADSIKSKISDFKKKGVEISIEEAYALVANHKRKNKELYENNRQKEILDNKNSGIAGGANVPTASGGKVTPNYKLDSDDKKALAQLQEMQPEAGWTPEKYYKMIKS